MNNSQIGRTKRIALYAFLSVVVLGFSSCNQKKETSQQIEVEAQTDSTEIALKEWAFLGNKTIVSDSVDFKGLIDKGAVILDVRTKEEYKPAHVKNSINIPVEVLEDHLSELNKKQTIITICQSGRRSQKAADLLKGKGFGKVYNGGSWFNIISLGLTLDAQGGKKEKTKDAGNSLVIHLTKDDFLAKVANFEKNHKEWQYLGDKPAIIDFYAPWCGPCKAIAPVLDSLAKEYAGQVVIYKVNTEEEPELTVALGVRNIPTFLFIPQKENPKVAEGAVPEKQLREIIQTQLLKK